MTHVYAAVKQAEAAHARLIKQELADWLAEPWAIEERQVADARAVLHVEPSPSAKKASLEPTPTRQGLLAELAWANEQPWPGRSGTTDQLSYIAVVRTAIAANNRTVGMSRYTLSELVGISPSTAYRSLERHVSQGRLLRHAPASEELATRYEVVLHNETRDSLRAPQDLLQNETRHVLTDSPLLAESGLIAQQPLPDLFRTRLGLSKLAFLLYHALEDGRPLKAAELARRVGKNRSTVGRALREQLFSAGLALETPNGWLRQPADFKKLAIDLGTAGATERTRKRNAEQRENYRSALERGMRPPHRRTERCA